MGPPVEDIHPLALIAAGARLGRGNRIGAGAIVEDDVTLGDDNLVLPYAVIKSGTRMGSGNVVHEHAVLGGVPQDLSYRGRETTLEIGDANVFREGVTISRGCKGEGRTVVGSHNYMMAAAHAGHDCRLADHIVIANGALLAGHVEVGEHAFISGNVVIHQFCRIGRHAMLSGGARIGLDAPPYFITEGSPARVRGLNLVGLKRAGFGAAEIAALKRSYRLVFQTERPLAERLAELAELDDARVRHLHEFLTASTRGFHRPR
jgi:UDP-N-acetylglucosamine acyltransferase